jgi:Ca-activated chloride channel family protein
MIKYANPEYAWLFLLVPVVALMIWLTHRRKLRMMQLLVGNTSLHQHLFRGYSSALNRWRYFLLLAALFFLVIAMVNPQIGTRTEQIKRKGVDVIVALDVSASMATRDLVPSRLDKAKYQVQSFIDLLQGDRIGLIAFAGLAHPQCPLTVDYAAAQLFLRQTTMEMMPVQGTAIGDAIRLAMKMFQSEEKKYKVLLIISDGEDLETDPLEAAIEAAEKGIIIHSVGVGTTRGAPVPVKSGSNTLKKDKSGQIVVSKLIDKTLLEIADKTGGIYVNVQSGISGLEKIYAEISNMQKREFAGREFSEYEDRYQGFLLIAIVFLLISLALPMARKVSSANV